LTRDLRILSGWWFFTNPFEKYAQVKNGNLPQIEVKIQKKLKPQPSCLFFRGVQFILNLFGNPLLLPFSRRPAPVSKAPLANKNAKSQEKLFFHHPEPSPMLTNLKKNVFDELFNIFPSKILAIFPKASSLAILPFSTNFIQCLISREDFLFVIALLIYNVHLNKFQPPSPVVFTPSFTSPSLRPTGN